MIRIYWKKLQSGCCYDQYNFTTEHVANDSFHTTNEALDEVGLTRLGESIVPKEVNLRNQWRKLIRQVLTDGETRYFVIHQHRGIIVLALSITHCRQDVQVHMPRKSVCSRVAIDRLGLLVDATPRERDVLECIAHGLSPTEIANCMGTRISTVRTQIKSLLCKLDQNGTRPLLHFLARIPDV